MLGIRRLSSRGADYYLSDLAHELPVPMGPRGGRSEWLGAPSPALGLHGEVDAAHLRAVLEGRLPDSGRPLRSERATVLGFDLTFTAPKSVSLLFGLGGEAIAAEVVTAHQQAVSGAVSYLEARAVTARRSSEGVRGVIPTSGLVGGSFTHGVSRNVDPHLHTHVVMANLVHGADGRWSACDQRGLSAHRAAASAVYDAHLRFELSRQLGVRWSPAGQHSEVRGMPPMWMGEFSSRGADIRQHMAKWGTSSRRGAQVAWATTRPPKVENFGYADLNAGWAQRAAAASPGEAHVAELLNHRDHARRPAPVDEHRFRSALSLAPDGAARRRDVVAAFGIAASDGATASTLDGLTGLWVTSDPTEVGIAEGAHQLRSLAPGSHLLRALGPRPVDPGDHAVWREAAQSIEAYRRQWGIASTKDALGADALPSGISSLPADRLVAHLRAARHIELTRQRLGQREPRGLEVDRGR